MPELENIEYSREGIIDAVRGYYNFLIIMYMDPSEVVSPHPDGWLEIEAGLWKSGSDDPYFTVPFLSSEFHSKQLFSPYDAA